ncbi:uncharacterized protein [Porites lutea]|uniref:uncharacterized protein isoform X3 n=1 Tax=Porites lutea TaxID=51062 RepID=UPI003CC581F6
MITLTSTGIAILLLGLAQDFLSVPLFVRGEDQTPDRTSRDRRAICHYLCSSKRNEPFRKGTSFDRCFRECSLKKRKDSGESLSSVEIKEDLNFPMTRSRRDTKNSLPGCPNIDTKHEGLGYILEKDMISVDFKKMKPNLTVEWEPERKNGYNWTSYGLLYHGLKVDQPACIIVPKDRYKDPYRRDKLQWIIADGEGAWKYPDPIVLVIFTYPGSYPRLRLEKYAPDPPEPSPLPPTSEGGSHTKIIAAAVGLFAGLVLLFVIVMVYRKRVSVCQTFSRDDDEANGNVQLLPVIMNNLQQSGPERFYACYYPESDEFQKLVASVVNFFRMNGYMVVMDVMSCSEMVNLGPERWAEQQIKKASKVLVFLSPRLLRLCGAEEDETQYSSQEHKRVWYEVSLLRSIYSHTHSAARMVCITLPQSEAAIDPQDFPLWAELRYRWPEDKRRILNRLNDRPVIQPL